jgi:L,D-transpeptidase ErfK/SrfK
MVMQANLLNLNKKIFNLTGILLIGAAISFNCNALTYKLPLFGNSIGKTEHIRSKTGDSLLDIAQEYGIGAYEIVVANPKLSKKKLKPDLKVTIPSQFILPKSVPREGLVLNLAEMRAYFYHPDGQYVSTYPIGIGRQGWSTPLGETIVISKKKDPSWRPPPSIHREAERNGKTLPLIVPAGPNNPLGKYALRLGIGGILIHGTNRPDSVGLRSSHGCIRMYANDIEELFLLVAPNTLVRLIYEPHHGK